MPPREHSTGRAGAVATLVHLCLVLRPQVEIWRDRLLGEVDRGAALEVDAKQENEGLVVAHQSIWTISRDWRVVDMVAGEKGPCREASSGDRMGRMNATGARIAGAEDFGEDAGVRGCQDLIPHR